ncbi:DsbE family thiol:disulfide interchange protein [Qipengyuania sp. CAU 1752]
MMKRLAIWIPLALFLFFAGLAAYQLTQPKENLVRSAMIGKPVPTFDLPGLTEGDPHVTEAIFQDGTPKLLNIWASWCAPCIAEVPYLEELAEKGAPIVGSALQDRPQDSAAFLERYGNPYIAIARDQFSELKVAVGSGMVPETFVIDGSGIIRYQHLGPIGSRDVPVILDELEKAR